RGATPFMVLLAALQALLSRLSGQEDLVVGSPVANRNRAEIEELIGFFVNTLALRGDLAGAPSFAGLLGRVREAALDAYAHQDLPFERLVEDLRPERSLAHAPLFQVLFALQNAPLGTLGLPGLTLSPVATAPGGSGFDLTLTLTETPSGFAGAWGYDPDLFDRTTVLRIAGSFEPWLAAALGSPEAPVAEQPLLSETERHQVRIEWNDTLADLPRTPVHVRLAEQARRAPEAVAVLFEDESLTHGELDRRANRLARSLRRRGIAPGARVGLCLERSLDLVAGLLGIWKAGAAYVPLDPAHPDERLAFLAGDTGMWAVITREGLAGKLPESAGFRLLVDTDGEEIAAESGEPLPAGAGASSLAYILHTSGSTGLPKGVEVEHGNLAAVLAATGRLFGWSPDDVMACVAPASFDIFLWELLSPLLAGGACRLLPLAPVLDVERWAALLPGLTRVHAVPALMRRLIEEVRRAGLSPRLRTLFAGGDAVPAELLAEMRRTFPGAELRVLYGPTEATILATSWAVPEGEIPAGARLGHPLPGVDSSVRDDRGEPVPIGVAGELWIGGAGVTRGYLGQEALTADRFPARDGRRWYRTGDRTRWLPDGTLEFLGRTDFQVKVRGVRIEPGEVEAALAGLEGVLEAAVVPRDDLPGGRGLVAWVVTDGPVEPAALREALRRRLPEAMIPARIARLPELPLTRHGKVDRGALETLRLTEEGVEIQAPRTPTEELLAGIWADLLGRERIGPDDSFFDLGGHSLLAARLVARVRDAFGVDLPLREVFEAPTVAAMARRIAGARQAEEAPPLVPVSRDGDLPASFAQERLWFLDRLAPGRPAYNLAVALRLAGELEASALDRAFDAVVERHESLRTTFAERDGRPVQVIAPPRTGVLEAVDLSPVEVEPWAAEEAAAPFDLERGPLLRARLLRLGEREHVLLLTLHHIVSDGWSMGVLVREVSALYAALTPGSSRRERGFGGEGLQYADYAVWQRQWLSGDVLERQLTYWRQRLAGAPPVLDLPTDRPRPAALDARGASETLETLGGVQALARARSVTPFMTLLAGFAAVLARWTGADDVVVGAPVANRDRPEIEGMIGLFVNTLVLRTDLSGDPSFSQLLARVREAALGAYAHADVPFEKLVEELHPERSLAHTPLFQVMLSLQNLPIERIEHPGLVLEPLPSRVRTANFDLSLVLGEVEDRLAGSLTYRAALFDATTVRRLLGHLRTLLAGAAAEPERRLSDLPLLGEAEQHQLLVEREAGEESGGEELCVHRLFEAQAARMPEAVAVIAKDETLTFAELDRRAEALAADLREMGVGPEVRVGLDASRSTGLLVGMLGIWKAGGAWVPLDPSHPRERLELLARDARVRGVVQGLEGHPGQPGTSPRGFLVLDDPHVPAPVTPRFSESGRQAAYVLYTSGSTGEPKGVVVEHLSLAGYLAWAGGLLGRDPIPAITSLAFDASLKQLLVPLLAGRPVHLLSEEAVEPAALLRELSEGIYGVLNCVPSLWHAVLELVESGEGPPPASLHRLLLGGEALPDHLLERTARLLPGTEIWNLYGPTEATANATAARLGPGGPVTLGRPIAGLRAYVLDPEGLPVPWGAIGELCVGGPSVARGYLGRPGLTAERFVPDPFSGIPGERLYRTGDRVRRLADGRLQFRGRTDHQVKVRGFRVEPGEVEALLDRHLAVREAAVEAREVAPGEVRLVAFVAGEGADLAEALRGYLRERLPAPMVPAVIAVLDSLPRTPTGKVDRRALATAGPVSAGQSRGYEAPRDPVERQLAAIWEELLGMDRVGLRDGFFALGGHSLLATRLASRIRRDFGVEVPLRSLFELPDLEALAREVTALYLGQHAPGEFEALMAELDGISEDEALELLSEGP
ncbi:MAG TPA: amino acid adenylation domain-containing protein, partial [Thermoanaerobaculia bacterium]|nr:amino acid adenylation domain-containing protein [Thermoanaerobaculia bacterium]